MVIDTLQLDIIVNNKGTTSRINSTTNALKNLHKVITDINGAGGVNAVVNGGGGVVPSSRGGSSRSSGSRPASSLMRNLNFGSMIAKLYFVRNITKQLGRDLAKIVQYGIDYEETLNLWQTAMRGNIAQARVFTSEMTKAYGISSATLMNYQATFKNMLSALGNISETTAYGLSEALTQMALDFSSLYNVSVESAMTKFQAVLSGQVRPIRTAGYDITEQTLFQLYQSIGGTKTVRQLNQTEKQLLRILAVYKQMERSGATGDLAKTLEISTANQLRMMNEQAKEFATWIGVAFNTMLSESGILIEINAWLYAGVALAKEFAVYMGYVEKDYGISWSDDIADASDEFDKLKGKLLGFDKFQVLASAGTEDVDIEQTLLSAIDAYKSVFNKADNPAFERSLELLKAWGLELDANGNIVGGFDKVKDRVTDIAKSIGGLITFIGLMIKPWMAFVGAIEYAYWTNEDFRDSMNQMLTQLGGAGLKVFKAMGDLFVAIADVLVPIIKGFAWLVDYLDEMELLDDAIYLVVGALLSWKTIKFIEFIGTSIGKLKLLITQFYLTKVAAAGMAVFGFRVAANAAKELFTNWNDMSGFERAITVFKLLAGAALVAAAAVAVFHTSWSVGIAAGVIAAGIAVAYGAIEAVKAKQAELEYHANGGLATKGSLFYAGEAGPELVTQTSGGGSTIMNMKQLEDAVARGYIRGQMATQSTQPEGNQYFGVDGQTLFAIMRNQANKNGYDFVKVR